MRLDKVKMLKPASGFKKTLGFFFKKNPTQWVFLDKQEK